MKRALVAAGLALIFCYCLSTTSCHSAPERGTIQTNWVLALRELGIKPLYPPQENVHVGDIYLISQRPDTASSTTAARDFAPLALWIAYADVSAVSQQFYSEQRPAFPSTPSADRSSNSDVPWDQVSEVPAGPRDPASLKAVKAGADPTVPIDSVPHSEGPVFEQRAGDRLRQVAFPEFFTISATATDLNALVPAHAFLASAAHTDGRRFRVDIHIPSAECASLPATVLLQLVVNRRADGSPCISDRIVQHEYLPLLFQNDDSRGPLSESPVTGVTARRILAFDVITEVYYTRALDVTVTAASTDSAAGGAMFIAPVGINSSVRGSEVTGATPGEGSNARVHQADASSAPGSGISVTAVSESSISLRRTYAHPVAIGYRGITLHVDVDSGEVVQVRRVSAAAREIAALTATKELLEVENELMRNELMRLDARTSERGPLSAVRPAEASVGKGPISDARKEELAAKGVSIGVRGGNTVLTISIDRLFRPGRTEFKEDARQLLDVVADVLRTELVEGTVWIAGHTDSDPVKKSAQSSSAWLLSSAHALAVLEYLAANAGIPDTRLVVAAYGASDPVAPNDSAANKARNRRIELTIRE